MKNKLIVLAIASVLGNSTVNAFELKLPGLLSDKSEPIPAITVGTKSNSIATAATATSSDAVVPTKPISPAVKPMATAATSPSEVNPYTGVRAAVEDNKIKIDAAITEADLYDKQFEAGKKKFLLENKDKIYRKELSEKLSIGSTGGGSSRIIDIPDLSGFDGQRAKPLKQSKRPLDPLGIGVAALAPPPAPPITPKLIGIMSDGKIKSAILSMGSESATVSDGGTFAGHKVTDISDSSIYLDGKKLNLTTSANTLSNPDKQDIGTAGKGSKPANGNPILSMQPQIQPAENFPMPANIPQM